MKLNITLCLLLAVSAPSFAQSIPNGGFENWGNPSPGVAAEPTGWYSNKSGSNLAQSGQQTCFKDENVKHSGSASVRVETVNTPILNIVVNGNVTTGVVNAPSISKSEGYLGTVNYSNSNDIRRVSFTNRPDSLVGWYQYTSGGANEKGKIKAVLHVDHFYDPEVPVNGNHPDASANKIGEAIFYTPTSSVSNWTRFSVPFTYVNSNNPEYIMLAITSSDNQETTVTGSKLWVDDLDVVYNPATSVTRVNAAEENVKVFSNTQQVVIDFVKRSEGNATFILTDMSGRKVYEQAVSNNQMTVISLQHLPMGIYAYQVIGAGFVKSGKVSL